MLPGVLPEWVRIDAKFPEHTGNLLGLGRWFASLDSQAYGDSICTGFDLLEARGEDQAGILGLDAFF